VLFLPNPGLKSGGRIKKPPESKALTTRRWCRPSTCSTSARGASSRCAEDPVTLEQLAAEFGVSRERVRQIEVRAFENVQKAVKNRTAAMESLAALPVH
jgi:Sigma-70, region 4